MTYNGHIDPKYIRSYMHLPALFPTKHSVCGVDILDSRPGQLGANLHKSDYTRSSYANRKPLREISAFLGPSQNGAWCDLRQ